MSSSNKIICALDFNNLSKAENFVSSIRHDIIFKVGMEFFFNFGMQGLERISNINKNTKIFLDLKLHDIPNTVSRAVVPLIEKINPYMITLHIAGGKKMLQEAIESIKTVSLEKNFNAPLILGVTVLTSLNDQEFQEMGYSESISQFVENYAKVASDADLDGIVCSPLEVSLVKKLYGNNLKIVTPGIRLNKDKNDDQSRYLTPSEAFKLGSDFIVMGRPLINSERPNEVIKKILEC
jgi:orotidine-5'-phosphate decarboxylase